MPCGNRFHKWVETEGPKRVRFGFPPWLSATPVAAHRSRYVAWFEWVSAERPFTTLNGRSSSRT